MLWTWWWVDFFVAEEEGDNKVSYEVYSKENYCLVLHIQSCSAADESFAIWWMVGGGIQMIKIIEDYLAS